MRSNFLKQISRMLVFGILITGFPARDVIAGPPICSGSAPATSCPLNFNPSTFPSGCPLLQDAAKKYDVSTINLNVGASGSCISCLSSPNSPSTISTYGISPIANFSLTASAPTQYELTTSNLGAAISNYQSALTQYGILTALNTTIISSLLSLMPNNGVMAPSPFAPAAISSNLITAAPPSGDFLPLSTAAGYSVGKMFINFLSSNVTQTWYQQLLVALVMYTILTSTASSKNSTGNFTSTDLGSFQNVFGGNPVPSTAANPPTSYTSFDAANYNTSAIPGYLTNTVGLQFVENTMSEAGSGTSTPIFNLLMNLSVPFTLNPNYVTGSTIPGQSNKYNSNINWTAIYNDPTQVTALVTAFNTISADIGTSQFAAVFDYYSDSGSVYSFTTAMNYTTYYLNAFKALQSNSNLYMDCSYNYNTGQPLDSAAIYYVTSAPGAVSSDLETQFIDAQIDATKSSPNPLTASTAATLEPTDDPLRPSAGISNVALNYKTGTFYYVGDIVSASDAQEMWSRVCGASSSASLLPIQNSAIQALVPLVGNEGSPLSSPDNTADGAAQYGLETLQGRMQNLIIAARAAINQPPISGISSSDAVWWSYTAPAGATAPALTNYSWVNSYNPEAAQNPSTITSVDRTVKVTPSLLPNFIDQSTAAVPAVPATASSPAIPAVPAFIDTTSFANNDHISMLMDLVAIRMAYSEAWVNLSLCANQIVKPLTADCGGTYKVDINIGAIHISKGSNFFSNHCFNKALGAILTSPTSLIVMAVFMGGTSLAGIIWKLRSKISFWRTAKETVSEAASAETAPGKAATPTEVPTGSGGDVPVGPGPGPGPNPVQPPVNSQVYDELRTAAKNAALQDQASTFDQAASPARTQALQDLRAQILSNIESAEEGSTEEAQAKGAADAFDERLSGSGETTIEPIDV